MNTNTNLKNLSSEEEEEKDFIKNNRNLYIPKDNFNTSNLHTRLIYSKVCTPPSKHQKFPILCGEKSKNPGYCVKNKSDCNKDDLPEEDKYEANFYKPDRYTSINPKKDLSKLSTNVDSFFDQEKINQNLLHNIDREKNNKSNKLKFDPDPRYNWVKINEEDIPEDNIDVKYLYGEMKQACPSQNPYLCGKKSKNPGYCVKKDTHCNANDFRNMDHYSAPKEFYLAKKPPKPDYTSIDLKENLDKNPKTLTINYDKSKIIKSKASKSQIKNNYNEKNKNIILRNIFEKNMFILDAFEDLKKNILTDNLLKYLYENNIFYNISFGFHSFQGVRTIENAEVEILFAFANYKNISLNNNSYFFIKQN